MYCCFVLYRKSSYTRCDINHYYSNLGYYIRKKKIFIIVLFILEVWILISLVDYIRVNNREKPLFCLEINLKKYGGSGHYICLGYSYDIEGNFMPDDDNYEVDRYSFNLFVIKLLEK